MYFFKLYLKLERETAKGSHKTLLWLIPYSFQNNLQPVYEKMNYLSSYLGVLKLQNSPLRWILLELFIIAKCPFAIFLLVLNDLKYWGVFSTFRFQHNYAFTYGNVDLHLNNISFQTMYNIIKHNTLLYVVFNTKFWEKYDHVLFLLVMFQMPMGTQKKGGREYRS